MRSRSEILYFPPVDLVDKTDNKPGYQNSQNSSINL